MKSHTMHRLPLAAALAALTLFPSPARTQDLPRGVSLNAFRPVASWRGVGEVAAVPGKTEFQTGGEGGILVNGTAKDKQIPYLITRDEYGDARVELEFMIPKDSNAGVYLMGRYEVQVFDSLGKARVAYDDLGGIYQRFDPALPKERQGFGGIAPMTNAAKAPGEWQTLDITFRAPRFDGAGKKTSDATFEKVLVNGLLVQENASTTGPTRSSPLEGEAPKGPIAIQGDHGPIAIRGFRVTALEDANRARIAELDAYWAVVSRAVNEGNFEAYTATCHDEGVLVSGSKQTTQPLAKILPRWKKDFVAARDGTRKASVEFRFSRRIGDATTAHETGIFLYTSQIPGGPVVKDYIQFEALLVKETDGWKILMENQQGLATAAGWDALK
jgi:hypothetical protein